MTLPRVAWNGRVHYILTLSKIRKAKYSLPSFYSLINLRMNVAFGELIRRK